MAEAFPLRWPTHRARKPASARKRAMFNKRGNNLSVADAIGRIQSEIAAIGGRYPVISSNVELRRDGIPRSGQREPDDPGVCLYFDLKGKPVALPCDTYNRVADNIAAIAAHLEATRKIERHGVATVSEMFAGFVSLPPPNGERKRTWREVFGFGPTSKPDRTGIELQYRTLAKTRHPDAGGSAAAMAELNAARDEALKEIGQ